MATVGTAAGAAVALQPTWLPLAATTILVVLVAGLRMPSTVTVVLGFLIAALPKSGVRFAELPLPFMLFGLAFALTLLLRRAVPPAAVVVRILAMLAAWIAGRIVVLAAAGASVAQIIAVIGWAVLPAVVLGFACARPTTGRGFRMRRRWGGALEFGVMSACIFAVVQVVAGVEVTTVPGVTIALGDSYESKFITVVLDDLGAFSKIPSTYQNGNVFGVVTAFFFVTAACRVSSRKATRWDLSLLTLTGTASLLAGSRTVVVALIVASFVGFLSRAPLQRRVGLGAAAVGVGVAAFMLQPGLLERFAVTSLTDSGGAGRTERWNEVLTDVGPRLIVGTTDWVSTSLAEGAVGAAQQIGVIGLLLIAGLAGVVTRAPGMQVWRLPLLVVAVCFLLDSSYFVFPTWFIPFARLWAPFHVGERSLDGRRTRVDGTADHVTHPVALAQVSPGSLRAEVV